MPITTPRRVRSNSRSRVRQIICGLVEGSCIVRGTQDVNRFTDTNPSANRPMSTTITKRTPANFTDREFPPFSLPRLLRTVFAPKPGQRVCILIDLDDPRDITDFRFLKNPDLRIQRHAYHVFYLGLRDGVLAELGLTGGEIFAYEVTGGSNLDLPE